MKRIEKKIDNSIGLVDEQINNLKKQMQEINEQLIHLQEVRQNLLIVQEELED